MERFMKFLNESIKILTLQFFLLTTSQVWSQSETSDLATSSASTATTTGIEDLDQKNTAVPTNSSLSTDSKTLEQKGQPSLSKDFNISSYSKLQAYMEASKGKTVEKFVEGLPLEWRNNYVFFTAKKGN